jgi:hypothetical protein
MGELLAFPGAMGFGKYTTGGRGGKVIHVTNLNDSGAGSLREALNTPGPRIIVFDVGGTIKLNTSNSEVVRLPLGSSEYDKNNDLENVTIAGETAPYPGITITGGYLDIHTSNVIVRYITFRANSPITNTPGFSLRIRNWGTNGYVQSNVIIDHCTITHGNSINFVTGGQDASRNTNKITFSKNLLGKGKGWIESNGDMSGGYNFMRGYYTYDISIVENYFAPCSYRSPLIGYGANNESAEIINNISYGSQNNMEISWGNIVDGIANIYKPFSNGHRWNVIKYFKFPDPQYGKVETKTIYINENIILPPFRNGSKPFGPGLLKNNQNQRQISNSLINSWYNDQQSIENAVLNDVGNSIHRETMDQQLINEYYSQSGSQNFYEKVPVPIKTKTRRLDNYDTDFDGMSDTWEIEVFGTLDKNASGDHNENGYTNIEEFFYYLTMGYENK